MAPLRMIRTFLLLFLLLIPLLSSGMIEGFKVDSMHPQYSLSKDDSLLNTRKMLMLGVVLDYDDAGANPKHDPRKKPGLGKP